MSTAAVENAVPPKTNRPPIYERLTKSELRNALHKMVLIRRFEESAEDAYVRGLSYGTMHLSIGEEATAVGSCMPLSDADMITSTHRGHGHCIAKGAEVKRMFAEFLGREDGYCRGRGGSMHIADPSKGNLGANGIVGGGIPIAVGAALSARRRKTGAVVVCFFGDGANNEGAFHESLNMASIWKLPVVFVCENNNYGMSMSAERSTAVKFIAERAKAYSMPGVTVNGNNFSEVAAGRVRRDRPRPRRRGAEPHRGHDLPHPRTLEVRPEPLPHQGRDRDVARARSDRRVRARARSVQSHRPTSEMDAVRAEVEEEIKQGVAFAEASPVPSTADLLRDVYTR